MHRLTALVLSGLLGTTLLFSDALKNNLKGRLHQKDTLPALVNLDAIPAKPKQRSPKAVVATVLGKKIRKQDVDRFLSKRTGGKLSDFDRLDTKQRIALIREMVLPDYIASQAKKAIPWQERKALYAQAWLSHAVKQTEVPDEEVRRVYDNMVSQALSKGAANKIPPFERVKDRLKLKMAEKTIISQLMRGADIKLTEEKDGIVGVVGDKEITLEDVKKAVRLFSRGTKTWDQLNEDQKLHILRMVAPTKIVEAMALQNLTLQQKHNLISNMWLQQKSAEIDVSDKEIKRRYAKMKKLSKRAQKKAEPLPPLERLRPMLKAQLAQEKVMKRLMKRIKVNLKK